MALFGDNMETLAKHIGISRQALSRKVNSKRGEFTQIEIQKVKLRYNLDAREVEEIFFDSKVSQKDTKEKED